MQTVESIISSVYTSPRRAAEMLGVSRPAVANWKSFGCFPSRLLPAICQHAREAGVSLDVSEIPIMEAKRADA